MRLTLNPAKLVWMFWPVYVLAALGAMLNAHAWRSAPGLSLVLASSPVLIFALGWAIQDHWWLELTPDALVHHTLFRAERFAWARMGSIELRAQEIVHLPLVRTLWFPFPLDAPENWRERITKRIGRRILLVFGDRSPGETMVLIDDWREGRRLG